MIKKAYLQMAKKFHPDANKSPEAVRNFQEASEAWETLGDDEKRPQYDRFGHGAQNMGGGGGGGGGDPFEGFRSVTQTPASGATECSKVGMAFEDETRF